MNEVDYLHEPKLKRTCLKFCWGRGDVKEVVSKYTQFILDSTVHVKRKITYKKDSSLYLTREID